MNGRSRYPDERLDDKFRPLDGLPDRMTTVEQLLTGQTEDLAALRAGFEERAKERKAERALARKEKEEARLERKADRRYQIGAVFTAAGIVIAAVGLFLDKL